MNPIEIIEKYYEKGSKLYDILIEHSYQVQEKALKIVDKHPELGADRKFIEEAVLLHDIGIYLTYAPDIYCFGSREYIEHGYLGSEIVKSEGFPRHALVCERHTGLGFTVDTIIEKKLPLPHRDLIPISIEEKIICYADKFYSKTKLNKELTVEKIVQKLAKNDSSQVEKFLEWNKIFE